MHDIKAGNKSGMPTLNIHPARGDGAPDGWTRVDADGLADAKADHAFLYSAWRADNPPDTSDPPPSISLRSPDGTRWEVTIDDLGNLLPKKVTR